MDANFSILFVDDDIYALENFKYEFKNSPYKTDFADSYKSAVSKLEEGNFNLLITDLVMPFKSGLELARFALEKKYVTDVILITGYGNQETVEEAIKLGLKDFVRKPYNAVDLKNSVEKIYKNFLLKLENEELKKRLITENKILKERFSAEAEEKFEIIGKSKTLQEILRKAEIIGKYSNTCLIQGESGTGKELLARYIHLKGARKTRPFIPVNCAELSPSLFEAELFGYVKGAFTGANETRPGLFEVADGGILFLDEISEIPINLQAKLLRVIEYQKIRRIGDSIWRKIDVQIIGSTNRPIEELSNGRILRNDLFHRIATLVLTLSPLRFRKDDIPELVSYFYKKYSKLYEAKAPPPDKNLIARLKTYNWPGNIRQLANFMRSYILFYTGGPVNYFDEWLAVGLGNDAPDEFVFRFIHGNIMELEDAKKWLILKVLRKYNFNQSKAARHLGMSYVGLHKYLVKNGIIEGNRSKF